MLFAIQDLWKERGDSNFPFFSELPVPPQAAEDVGTLYIYIYHYGILNTTISFLNFTYVILFLQGLLLCVCMPFHNFFAGTLCTYSICLTSLTNYFNDITV